MVNGLRGGGTRLGQVSVIIEVKQRPDRIINKAGVLEKGWLVRRVVVGVSYSGGGSEAAGQSV